ncbi:MAG: response regulator [Anaerolineaceae bacterium]|jgi:CheY-like chemotaxis protein/anti-sigma regulatory factor (Ser/Thr protein kinase)
MKKILVIENEDSVRNNVLELLDAEGYLAAGAKDGEEGARLAWDNMPDLIVCDILMPNLDGFGVLARLKKEPRTITIPFLFLTALQERHDMRKGMRLGADDFITKPFTREELLDAVQVGLEKQQVMIDQVERKLTYLRENILHALPHELVTPISVVLGFSELILDDLEDNNTSHVREMAQNIHNAGMRLMRLVQNYLLLIDLEMISSNPEQINDLRETDISSAATIIMEIGQLKARQEGREAHLDIAVDETSLKIAETSLQKIVEELLDNAFRYSKVGSPVSLLGKKEEDQGVYRLEVTDKGQGMSMAQIRSAELGLQDVQDKNDQQGTGMGLLIVKHLVDIYGGTLNIHSSMGLGTTVEILFPI